MDKIQLAKKTGREEEQQAVRDDLKLDFLDILVNEEQSDEAISQAREKITDDVLKSAVYFILENDYAGAITFLKGMVPGYEVKYGD